MRNTKTPQGTETSTFSYSLFFLPVTLRNTKTPQGTETDYARVKNAFSLLRNTKTPQGTETVLYFEHEEVTKIEKYEDPAGDGNCYNGVAEPH